MLQPPNLRLPTTVTKHFYADGLQVAKMVGTGTYYLHEDALGSVRLETTTTVTVKFSSNYVPYGSNYAMTGKEVFMYIGQPYSSVTGLYYLGARYYDPTIGRFITEDSYEGDDNDPMTLNRYIYGRDNPERYTDPSGHMLLVAEGGGGGSPTCSGSPDVCLTREGNYQYSNPTPSSTPPSTTTTATTTHTVTTTTETYESTETETTTTTTTTSTTSTAVTVTATQETWVGGSSATASCTGDQMACEQADADLFYATFGYTLGVAVAPDLLAEAGVSAGTSEVIIGTLVVGGFVGLLVGVAIVVAWDYHECGQAAC